MGVGLIVNLMRVCLCECNSNGLEADLPNLANLDLADFSQISNQTLSQALANFCMQAPTS